MVRDDSTLLKQDALQAFLRTVCQEFVGNSLSLWERGVYLQHRGTLFLEPSFLNIPFERSDR